jgi:hypothetical protein
LPMEHYLTIRRRIVLVPVQYDFARCSLNRRTEAGDVGGGCWSRKPHGVLEIFVVESYAAATLHVCGMLQIQDVLQGH